MTRWPYRRRRAALESVFAARQLSASWALCPSTTEVDTVREWLTWASVGMEGVVFKRLDDAYQPSVRGWLKYKNRMNCICCITRPGLKKQFTQVRRVRMALDRTADAHDLHGDRWTQQCCV